MKHLSSVAVAILMVVCSFRASAETVEWQIDYQITAPWIEPFGTVFEIETPDVYCAAGFVHASQTRFFSNQNDLEFWCRSGSPNPLRFKSIGKAIANDTATFIANIDGQLVETESNYVYDWVKQAWRFAPLTDWLRNERFFASQRSNDTRLFFVVDYDNECPGIAIYDRSGYRTTIWSAEWRRVHSLIVRESKVFAAMGFDIWAGIFPERPDEECHRIELERIDGPRSWTHGFYSADGKVIFGGTLPQGCAPVYVLDPTSHKVVTLPPRLNGRHCRFEVTDYYSFTQFGSQLIVGSYPQATLLSMSARAPDSLMESRYAEPVEVDWFGSEVDWFGNEDHRYRESQSVVTAYGRLWVGLWPWGEILSIDPATATEVRYRLFRHPLKTNAEKTPYHTPLRQQAAPDDVQRILGAYPTSWGQRVQNIVFLNGRVCASTGNRAGRAYDPRWHAMIANPDAYGAISCADLTNHTLASLPARRGTLRFVLTRTTMQIHHNGTLIAENRHQLSREALEGLTKADVTTGEGAYGPFLGSYRGQP